MSRVSTAARMGRRRMVTNPLRFARPPGLLRLTTTTMMMTRLTVAIAVHLKAFEVGLGFLLQIIGELHMQG